MQAKSIVILLVLAIGTGSAAYAFSMDDQPDGSVVPEVNTVQEDVQPDTPVERKADAAKPKPKPKVPFTLEEDNVAKSADRLQLPNGKSVPILNGAYGAKNGWPEDVPYSPIIKVQLDSDGNYFYLHEDGSQTKTMHVRNSVSGKSVVVTQVSNPTDPVAMDPTEVGKVLKEEQKRKNARDRRRRKNAKNKSNQKK